MRSLPFHDFRDPLTEVRRSALFHLWTTLGTIHLRSMQPNSPSLPVRWYLASLIAALCLACLLVAAFEVLARDEPTLASATHSDSTILDPSKTISTISAASPNSAQMAPPATEPEQIPLKTVPRKHLWEMLVTPVVTGVAGLVVAIGALLMFLSLVAARKRRLQ